MKTLTKNGCEKFVKAARLTIVNDRFGKSEYKINGKIYVDDLSSFITKINNCYNKIKEELKSSSFEDCICKIEEIHREAKLAVKKELKELNKKNDFAKKATMISDSLATARDISRYICMHSFNVGEHVEGFDFFIGDDNKIEVTNYYSRYSSRCTYTKVSRFFTIYCKKGYKVKIIGGLVTFYRGKIKRDGIKCQWVEQGKKISELKTVNGFLVKGEHIAAKSLESAKKISKENRTRRYLQILKQRRCDKTKKEQIKDESYKVTIQDSLNAGNCLLGTLQFKNRYENSICHTVRYITIHDLKKYANLFNVEIYANRVIDYLNRI